MLASDNNVVVNMGVCFVFAIANAVLASSRGRSPVAWFLLGFFFMCLALILLLVLPDLKQLEAKDRRLQLETRRLREQIAKERQTADQRHHHVERRLGAHDKALALDTSEANQLGQGGGPPPALPNTSQWFYARGRERMGPVSAETIHHLLHAGAIDAGTLVWRDGMPDWVAANRTEEFGGDKA